MGIFLASDSCRRVQASEESGIPRQRKQAGQAKRNKPASRVPAVFPWMVNLWTTYNKPFLPYIAWVSVLSQHQRDKLQQAITLRLASYFTPASHGPNPAINSFLTYLKVAIHS